MILILFLKLLLMIPICRYFKKIKLSNFFLIASLLLILLIGQGWVPSVLLKDLEVGKSLENVSWKEKNIIIVLGSGTKKWPHSQRISSNAVGYTRIHEAIRLYNQCRANQVICHLLLSGGHPGNKLKSEAEIMRNEILELGIKADDIFLEDKSRNTFENAKFSGKFLMGKNYDLKILVTSGFHLKRAQIYFKFFAMQTTIAPADFFIPSIKLIPSALNFFYTDLALHEYLGLLRFKFYNFMGWNEQQTLKPKT